MGDISISVLTDWLRRFQAAVTLHQTELTELDSVIGDADHGANMVRGMNAGATPSVDAAGLGAALRAGVDGIVARGKAEAGDKTMFDALAPAVDAWDASVAGGGSGAEAAAAAATAAEAGRDATIPLVARKGRASYLGERSAGHLDPGAASSALLLRALADALGG